LVFAIRLNASRRGRLWAKEAILLHRDEVLHQLKELYDQTERTRERGDHLFEQMPLHVHPQSLNYGKDLDRKEADYNRLVRVAQRRGVLTEADLTEAGLPGRLEGNRKREPVDLTSPGPDPDVTRA
jgi:hypothetical protein